MASENAPKRVHSRRRRSEKRRSHVNPGEARRGRSGMRSILKETQWLDAAMKEFVLKDDPNLAMDSTAQDAGRKWSEIFRGELP